MKPTQQQFNDFLAHKALPGVVLEHNDHVAVVAGEHSNDHGSIVSLEELGEDPIYLVELESGRDAYIQQSRLRFLAHDK